MREAEDIDDDHPENEPVQDTGFNEKVCDALETLLAPYVPADDPLEADKLFSTNDIISALEMHYGVPQGSTDYITLAAGPKIVEILTTKGFKYANTGGLSLQWMFRKKGKCL
jgi:hypothetical protein